MTGMERIMATLAGSRVDRRAFIPVASLYGARLTDCPLDRYYSDPSAYAAGQAAVRREFEPDVLLAPFAFALIGAAFGSEVKFSEHQAPTISRPAVATTEEWDRLVAPDPDTERHLLFLRRSTRMLATEFQGVVPVAACLPAPIDIPALVMGMEGWLDLVLFDPAAAVRVLERASSFFVMLANRLFADGAMVVIVPCGFASPSVLMRGPVKSLMRPALEHSLCRLEGPSVLHHAGTGMLGHLDVLAGLPSVAGFALDHREGLPEVRRLIGRDAVLLSGPHGPDLAEMDAAGVEALCRSILEERRVERDTRFILATTGADIPLHTPPENVNAMANAVRMAGWGLQ